MTYVLAGAGVEQAGLQAVIGGLKLCFGVGGFAGVDQVFVLLNAKATSLLEVCGWIELGRPLSGLISNLAQTERWHRSRCRRKTG